LHALNLFVAQLRTEKDQSERERLAARIDAAVSNMNELFNALLDISRLDAGALTANVSDFPVINLLNLIETTFAAPAREKGLRLRMVPSSAWVRSDPILLERILLNLVSNAVHYTSKGSIVVGCRRAGRHLRIDVCDSGIGIAPDQQREIFNEFYQIGTAKRARRDGLGLGLAIVERLGALLGHPIGLVSAVSHGSRFHVTVPLVAAPVRAPEPPAPTPSALDPLRDKTVVVIDDDPLVLEGTGGLLKSWGCRVVTANSDRAAVDALDGRTPDLIISDFRLKDGQTGIEAIARLCDACRTKIPAFLISGDILPERLFEAKASGYQLLHKPVSPMTLRTLMSRFLKTAPDGSRQN
jgi:CheY-like chemotaxis protein